MWWEYFLFVCLNAGALGLAMIFWKLTPKPTPNDYTTIPGLKLEGSGEGNQFLTEANLSSQEFWQTEPGNAKEMQAFPTFSAFLRDLHEDFGPLVSFFWGPRYVVSIGDAATYKELLNGSDKIRHDIEPWDVFGILCGKPIPKTKSIDTSTRLDSGVKHNYPEKYVHLQEKELKNGLNSIDLKSAHESLRKGEGRSEQIIGIPEVLGFIVKEEIDLLGHPIPPLVPILISTSLIQKKTQ